MIYPVNIKPVPRIAQGNHKGAPITHVGVTDSGLDIYTPDTVIKGDASLLPQSLQRILGNVLKQAASRPGPFIITPEEVAEDKTYDLDSTAPSKYKPEPEEVSWTHPKERRLKQQLGLMPPETETEIEAPIYEKFPLSLPSKHPKELMLEKEMEEHVDRQDED